jgi:two-component sensor histidine kinase
LQNLIYCGLILNELLTNSFKYAFEDKGEISMSTEKKEQNIYMTVKDNGTGFKQNSTHSLGLVIVETLVTKQLEGTVSIEAEEGCTTTIIWSEDV